MGSNIFSTSQEKQAGMHSVFNTRPADNMFWSGPNPDNAAPTKPVPRFLGSAASIFGGAKAFNSTQDSSGGLFGSQAPRMKTGGGLFGLEHPGTSTGASLFGDYGSTTKRGGGLFGVGSRETNVSDGSFGRLGLNMNHGCSPAPAAKFTSGSNRMQPVHFTRDPGNQAPTPTSRAEGPSFTKVYEALDASGGRTRNKQKLKASIAELEESHKAEVEDLEYRAHAAEQALATVAKKLEDLTGEVGVLIAIQAALGRSI